MPDDNVFTYWKAGPDAPKSLIGGQCRVSDLPPHAIVKDIDLPTEIQVETRGAGTDSIMTLTTPPIFGGRYAYRYRAVISSSTRDSLAEKPDMWTVFRTFHAERLEGPFKDSRRSNWWWSQKDGFWRGCEAPVRLIVKWGGPLLEMVTHECGCENRDELIAEHQARIDNHKQANRRASAQTANYRRYGRKRNGTVVIAPSPIFFNSGSVVQVFTLMPFGRRDQLGPHDTAGVRYRVPAKSMQPVHPEWLEEISAPEPVGHLALLAARKAALEGAVSSHDRIRISGKFDGAILDWEARAKTWFAHTGALCAKHKEMTEDLHVRFATLRNCQKIFLDYLTTLPPAQRDPLRDEITTLMARFEAIDAPICTA